MGKQNKKDGKDKNSKQYREYNTRYPPNRLVLAKNKLGEWREAKVLDTCPKTKFHSKPSEENLKYYVHYVELNRRWDEWVTFDRIQPWESIVKSPLNQCSNLIEHDEHEGLDERNLAKHEESTKIKTINSIAIGKYECETWYFSPFPEYFQGIDILYVCEFCLSFYRSENELERHGAKCIVYHPLGNEVYRDREIAVFEVDGARNVIYCENLCFLSKLFLDHKNLGFDAEPFLFYILTEVDEFGCHFAGYFSKEKDSQQGNNLSCILMMPYMQRKGYGKFLISFSYELSKREQKKGTPERPLSDLGYASYFNWWAAEIIQVLEEHQGQSLSINDISDKTYITVVDILEVVEKLNILRQTVGNHVLYANPEYLQELRKTTGKPGRTVFPEKLHWAPIRMLENLTR